jgi:hypothetical protein
MRERHPDVDQRAEEHVAARAGAAIQPADQVGRQPVIWPLPVVMV